MPSSFQAAAVIAIALLPGALYVWAFERQVGRYGIGLSDRVLRFVGGSALQLAIVAGPLYWILARHGEAIVGLESVPWWLLIVPILHVASPIIAGTVIGLGVRRRATWVSFFTGPDPAPRGWDYLFQRHVDGWIRLKLKSGSFLGGAYVTANGRRSYAAGYPEPQDLYLAATVEVDPETGTFVVDDEGNLRIGEGGLLLRWEEVEYLEFIDA